VLRETPQAAARAARPPPCCLSMSRSARRMAGPSHKAKRWDGVTGPLQGRTARVPIFSSCRHSAMAVRCSMWDSANCRTRHALPKRKRSDGCNRPTAVRPASSHLADLMIRALAKGRSVNNSTSSVKASQSAVAR
jgi:hypothetical protein